MVNILNTNFEISFTQTGQNRHVIGELDTMAEFSGVWRCRGSVLMKLEAMLEAREATREEEVTAAAKIQRMYRAKVYLAWRLDFFVLYVKCFVQKPCGDLNYLYKIYSILPLKRKREESPTVSLQSVIDEEQFAVGSTHTIAPLPSPTRIRT